MGLLAQFLLSLTNLVRSGAIKKIPQAIKFAEQQFGKVSPLLKKQIEKVFESAKKPVVGKAGKKEGTVIPLVRKIAEKKEEGIMATEEAGPLMDRLDDVVDTLQKNPKRPGGSLDPATGLTRALARRILDKKGIQIGKKDPIEVFSDTFGESISDVNNLAEEMLEIDSRGGGMKDMDQMLEADGLFDIEIPKNPQRGLTDQEMLELEKQVTDEKILTDFDPKGRKPSATGGRVGLKNGSPEGIITIDDKIDEMISFYKDYLKQGGKMNFQQFSKKYIPENFATGGRVRAASGGLADLLKL